MGDADIVHTMVCAVQPVRAWLALAAFCGLRCREIAALTREDVVDGVPVPFLRVTGKGGKDRIVPLPESVLVQLRAAVMPPRGPLFARMDGNPGAPSPVRVSERIDDHLHGLGIAGTAHALRHRYDAVRGDERHSARRHRHGALPDRDDDGLREDVTARRRGWYRADIEAHPVTRPYRRPLTGRG